MQKYAHLVELEKCCQTNIFLQNFVLIQPRTSPPKFANFANFAPAMQAQLLRLADPAGAAYGAHLTPEEGRDASGPESVGGATGTPPRHTGMR